MKKSIVAIALFIPLLAGAQNLTDAIRFSQMYYGNTARSMSMGGAFTSLGGDFSSLSINPAGAGVYRKTELTFTPSIYVNAVSTDYQGLKADGDRAHMILDNFGYVANINTGNDRGLAGVSFFLGYNRLNNFNQDMYSNGRTGVNQTMANHAFAMASDFGTGSYWDNMGYNTYLLNEDDQGLFIPADLQPVQADQRYSRYNSGSSGEWTFGTGFNISHKFYFGGSVNYMRHRFESLSSYREYNFDNTRLLNYSDYTRELSQYGDGINLKAGFILRPLDWIRIGGSIHSPTWYWVGEDYADRLTANYKEAVDGYSTWEATLIDDQGAPIDYAKNEYKFSTPMRVNAGLGFIIGKLGLVSFDYEYIDYSNVKFRNWGMNNDFTLQNQDIKDFFQSTHNYRAGLEVNLGKIALRGGFAYYDTPYKTNFIEQGGYSYLSNTMAYSGGIGYHSGHFFMDLGYQLLTNEETSYFYPDAEYTGTIEPAKSMINQHRVAMTFGFRF